MRELEISKLFKKQAKLSQRRGKDMRKLQVVIDKLRVGEPLEARYGDHALTGNLLGVRDCHIEPDWVLLYELTDDLVYLVKLGTHSDLF